ncbi:MAG: hypothetical protein NC212_10540 [Staphylococcus sp.]|nr:hypothetical protein [Staphylococcus sp.]
MKTIATFLLSAIILPAAAQTDTHVTVDGKEITGQLTRMTFDGPTVTLTFDDNTTLTSDMAFVSVTLDHKTTSAIIPTIADAPRHPSGVYNLRGQYLGKSPANLQRGFYIVNGQKVFVK